MADRPILFSASMVRAIIEGRKTQTRRVIKLPHNNPLGSWEPTTVGGDGVYYRDGAAAPKLNCIWHTRTGECIAPKIQAGDRLWVREAVVGEELPDGLDGVRYLADDAFVPIADTAGSVENWLDLHWYGRQARSAELRGRSVPSIHMPKWASRVTLIVTDVRVEQLQDISEDDAAAEGWPAPEVRAKTGIAEIRDAYPIGWYAALWESINGLGSWQENPWVAAYTFRPILSNIGQIGGET